MQECIDIIAPYSVRMIKPGEEYLHPIQEIKEHFGLPVVDADLPPYLRDAGTKND